jgi:uncharacterized protein
MMLLVGNEGKYLLINLLFLFLTSSIWSDKYLMNNKKESITNNQLLFDPVTEDNPGVDAKNPASMAPVVFNSNGSKLFGTMFLAGGSGFHPTALLLGGFPGNEVNFDIAHMIRRYGYNVFTFYPRGSFGSEGEYSWFNLVEDGRNAYRLLKSNFIKDRFFIDAGRIFLVGYSMGGFSALYNSIFLEEIKNVCAIAPFNSGYFGSFLQANPNMITYSAEQMYPAMEFVKSAGAEYLLNEFIVNQQEWNLLNHLDALAQKNILMIGAKFDSIAPLNLHHLPLQQKLQEVNPGFQSHILDTGHSFADKRIQLMRIISGWINKLEF